MSDSPDHFDRAQTPAGGSGVLAGLPRARPQRTTARRAAARASRPAGKAAPKPSSAPTGRLTPKPSSTSAGQPARKPRSGSTRRPARAPVPEQGYEAEPETLGGPVQPPGGAELIASAAELAGELAKTGVTAGARALRDLFSRLPG